jgi:hypothetical protein
MGNKELLKSYTEFLIMNNYIASLNNIDEVINRYYNIFDKKDKFSQDFIDAVHKINEKYKGNVVFCGSFGLVLNELINRSIKDIDILTFENHFYSEEREIGDSGIFYVGDIEVLCFKEKINNITIDTLYRNDVQNIKYSNIDFYNVSIKVELPQSAIMFKKQYVKSNKDKINTKKHLKDLENIKIKLGL